MSISEKIQTIDNTTEQNEAQYDLGRQASKISPVLSENFGKCGF